MLNRELKIGDKIYSPNQDLYGTIIELDIYDNQPYLVEFNDGDVFWFGKDGKDISDDSNYIILTHD